MNKETLLEEHDIEEPHRIKFWRPDDPDLIFYQVAKYLGFSVDISTTSSGDEFHEAHVTISPTVKTVLEGLREKIKSTRIGDAVWSAGQGAPCHLDTLRRNGQDYIWAASPASIKDSPTISEGLLDACFLRAYERVDGYSDTGNDVKDIAESYTNLTAQGAIPINPEGMGIIIHNEAKRFLAADNLRGGSISLPQ